MSSVGCARALANAPFYRASQEPYNALVKRLEAYQTSGKAPTREMELVTAQQTISKKSAWKVGFKSLVHALNSGTN